MCNDPTHQFCLSRRAMLTGAAALAAAPWAAGEALAQDSSAPQNAITPDAALKRLMDGNARYVAKTPSVRDFGAGRAARAEAQYPVAAVLSCADSRVAPEFAFDQGAGDLFVVRLAGNFANDDGIASLEYAVRFLKVPLIMVLGHSSCGAVDAAIKVWQDNACYPAACRVLINALRPAVAIAQASGQADLLEKAIAENVRQHHNAARQHRAGAGRRRDRRQDQDRGRRYDLPTGKVNLVDRSLGG